MKLINKIRDIIGLITFRNIYLYFNTSEIPVIIINFNQLFYLQQLLEFLFARGFKNIIIIDNASTYPPLLEYYEKIRDRVILEIRKDNLGHMVFYKEPRYLENYGKGFYILTDADIVPNPNLPSNFIRYMIRKLIKYYKYSNKVGFALNIDDVPDCFTLKSKVLNWESQFWKYEIEKDIFKADVDTTFALYKPGFNLNENQHFLLGLRVAGNFTARHGGWYIDSNNLSEENLFYMQLANKSASWSLSNEADKRYD